MHSNHTFPSAKFPIVLLAGLLAAATTSSYSQDAPPGAASSITGAQVDVQAILPNGRQIRPAGAWVSLAPYPFAIALRSDGAQAAIPSIGFPFALNLVEHPDAENLDQITTHRVHDSRQANAPVETHAGLAYSPDGSLLYVATGDSGKIAVYYTKDWTSAGEVPLDGTIGAGGGTYKGSFAATLVLSHTGRWLFALDQANWRIVVIDTTRRERVATLDTGALPFALALSPDDRTLYVTNTGLFEYQRVKGLREEDHEGTGLHFPPFGYPSAAARHGVVAEGKQVPGLGDENSSRGSSLWTYELGEEPSRPMLVAKLRLGTRIAPNMAIGGAAPTGIAADTEGVYISLAHQDSLVKVSTDGKRLLGEAALSPFKGPQFLDSRGRPLRGIMPSGVAVQAGRLYVAESGINAVAVLDASTMRVLEHIPTGWNPSAVALSPDGSRLYVVNAKGRGTGPNGGKGHIAAAPSYIGSLEYGSLGVVRLDALPQPAVLTTSVISANLSASRTAASLPPLKHCFLIIRENRTFDEVLGDLSGANGDPALGRYGLDGWAEENKQAIHLRVTPNLHAMARQFAASDNFYVDSDVSADGHRWVLGINPTPFFNTAWTSNYGGRRSSSPAAEQPGRRALFGGNDAPMPEDQPQFGSLWEHVARSGKGILNYGEGLEVEGSDEIEGLLPEGQRLLLNAPIPEPVFEASDRRYPTFNLGIPDQLRVDEFERDMRVRIAQKAVPALIVIRLPNDHTAAPRPADGYPYRASYVADNDLALGRIISFLSRSSLWGDSAVFVTEDDAQGGVDHVDAHRSLLVIASPWVRPGALVHQHVSMGSITHTIDGLLALGPLNLEDALAGEVEDVFSRTPQASGARFDVRPSDPRVFSPTLARPAHPRNKAESAALRDMDDPAEIEPEVERTAHRASAKD